MMCSICGLDKAISKRNDQCTQCELDTKLGYYDKKFESDPTTKRLCRVCNQPLPASRYFKHAICDRYYNAPESIWTGDEFGTMFHNPYSKSVE